MDCGGTDSGGDEDLVDGGPLKYPRAAASAPSRYAGERQEYCDDGGYEYCDDGGDEYCDGE